MFVAHLFWFSSLQGGEKKEEILLNIHISAQTVFFPFPETQNREAQLQMVDVCMEDSLSVS